jgi:hypothetical protein
MSLDQKMLLFDYAAMRNPDDKDDLRIDLPTALKDDIGWPKRKELDVVAFTHLDNDHIAGSSEFFHLDHAVKYQGEGRVKIKELWVPAAALTEVGAEDEARVIREEAKYRLKRGEGIRVFSRPAHLEKWFKDNDLTLESRKHLITDAGQIVPGLSKEADGVEFFVHSPFGERDGDVVLDRNDNSLVFQAAFKLGDTRFLMAADTTWENWDRIVKITKRHNRQERLQWDIYKLPHHCSYLSLSPEKGETETVPTPEVQWLLDQGKSRPTVVSTSWPIADVDEDQPPHFQAKNRYKKTVAEKAGKFIVTMEHPTRVAPKRLIIDITAAGASLTTVSAVGSASAVSMPAPRVG